MATLYTTRPGDMLDQICMARYGRASGAVEAVLSANAGLGDAVTRPRLAGGLALTLPDLTEPETAAEPVRLWD